MDTDRSEKRKPYIAWLTPDYVIQYTEYGNLINYIKNEDKKLKDTKI